jgi:NAD(P)-dependent dehydrogenase (short-subunit alcohol dehydrogenase family)
MDLAEISKMYDFTERTIVITGGTGVLGGEIACALVGCGANVAIIDRNPTLADDQLKKIETACGRIIVVYGDVLDRKLLENTSKKICDTFGSVHAVINAAGGNHPGATTNLDQTLFDLPEEALRKVLDLNMLGTIIPCQVFARTMANKGEGVIINISSMSAMRPLTRVPAYSASKAAISNFTQWFAVYMAQTFSPKIRVNAIAPGFFLTEQNEYLLKESKTGKLTARGKQIIEHTPMGRFGNPEDLLGAVLWLLSPASEFVTGIVLPIDGGFSAYSGV